MKRTLALVALVGVIGVAGSVSASEARAHRAGCHNAHSCPSDHATYVWRGKLCVSPTSDKRTARFKIRIRYGGRTYFCRRV